MKTINTYLLLTYLSLASLLTGCILAPIPESTANTAIIKLYTQQPNESLMAESIDRKRVNDGRYFQVTEGRHRIEVLYQYDTNEEGLPTLDSDQTTCFMSFYYDFKAGNTYHLEGRSTATGGQLRLSKDNQPLPLDFSDVNVSCGPY